MTTDDKLPTPEQFFVTISTSPASATWVTEFFDLAGPAMIRNGTPLQLPETEELVPPALRRAVAAKIERLAVADAALARELSKKLLDDPEPRERPAEHRRRKNATALAQMAELHRQGKGRDAASIVARQVAVDPHDPHEVDMIAQRLRRLWRDSRG
jgi:hypothetical protein